MAGFTRRGIVAGAGALVLAERASALTPPPPAPLKLHPSLAPLQRFVGSWDGQGEGEPGESIVARLYEPAIGGRFLMVRNSSTYLPQAKNPKGETHEDLGFFSFDKARKRFVLRQFNVEGFVNQFVATSADFEDDTLVVESEAIENIGPGWRARETYRFKGADAFEEIFELAAPGKGFAVYSHNRLRRG